MKNNKQYAEGSIVGMWMAIGIAIFSGLGITLSVATDNPGMISLGPALGMLLGLAIGTAQEAKYRKEGKIRPLTEKEKVTQKKATIAGIVILILGILAFLVLLFL